MSATWDLRSAALRAAQRGLLTSALLAEREHVSRSRARATLRRLETEGLLEGRLIGGGELGYARARRPPAPPMRPRP